MSRQCLRVSIDWLSECSESCFLADTSQPCKVLYIHSMSMCVSTRGLLVNACEIRKAALRCIDSLSCRVNLE